jgi:hypothetical protein
MKYYSSTNASLQNCSNSSGAKRLGVGDTLEKVVEALSASSSAQDPKDKCYKDLGNTLITVSIDNFIEECRWVVSVHPLTPQLDFFASRKVLNDPNERFVDYLARELARLGPFRTAYEKTSKRCLADFQAEIPKAYATSLIERGQHGSNERRTMMKKFIEHCEFQFKVCIAEECIKHLKSRESKVSIGLMSEKQSKSGKSKGELQDYFNRLYVRSGYDGYETAKTLAKNYKYAETKLAKTRAECQEVNAYSPASRSHDNIALLGKLETRSVAAIGAANALKLILPQK